MTEITRKKRGKHLLMQAGKCLVFALALVGLGMAIKSNCSKAAIYQYYSNSNGNWYYRKFTSRALGNADVKEVVERGNTTIVIDSDINCHTAFALADGHHTTVAGGTMVRDGTCSSSPSDKYEKSGNVNTRYRFTGYKKIKIRNNAGQVADGQGGWTVDTRFAATIAANPSAYASVVKVNGLEFVANDNSSLTLRSVVLDGGGMAPTSLTSSYAWADRKANLSYKNHAMVSCLGGTTLLDNVEIKNCISRFVKADAEKSDKYNRFAPGCAVFVRGVNQQASCTISGGSYIHDNCSSYTGAGVHVTSNGKATITDSTITYNSSLKSGGNVSVIKGGTCEITHGADISYGMVIKSDSKVDISDKISSQNYLWPAYSWLAESDVAGDSANTKAHGGNIHVEGTDSTRSTLNVSGNGKDVYIHDGYGRYGGNIYANKANVRVGSYVRMFSGFGIRTDSGSNLLWGRVSRKTFASQIFANFSTVSIEGAWIGYKFETSDYDSNSAGDCQVKVQSSTLNYYSGIIGTSANGNIDSGVNVYAQDADATMNHGMETSGKAEIYVKSGGYAVNQTTKNNHAATSNLCIEDNGSWLDGNINTTIDGSYRTKSVLNLYHMNFVKDGQSKTIYNKGLMRLTGKSGLYAKVDKIENNHGSILVQNDSLLTANTITSTADASQVKDNVPGYGNYYYGVHTNGSSTINVNTLTLNRGGSHINPGTRLNAGRIILNQGLYTLENDGRIDVGKIDNNGGSLWNSYEGHTSSINATDTSSYYKQMTDSAGNAPSYSCGVKGRMEEPTVVIEAGSVNNSGVLVGEDFSNKGSVTNRGTLTSITLTNMTSLTNDGGRIELVNDGTKKGRLQNLAPDGSLTNNMSSTITGASFVNGADVYSRGIIAVETLTNNDSFTQDTTSYAASKTSFDVFGNNTGATAKFSGGSIVMNGASSLNSSPSDNNGIRNKGTFEAGEGVSVLSSDGAKKTVIYTGPAAKKTVIHGNIGTAQAPITMIYTASPNSGANMNAEFAGEVYTDQIDNHGITHFVGGSETVGKSVKNAAGAYLSFRSICHLTNDDASYENKGVLEVANATEDGKRTILNGGKSVENSGTMILGEQKPKQKEISKIVEESKLLITDDDKDKAVSQGIVYPKIENSGQIESNGEKRGFIYNETVRNLTDGSSFVSTAADDFKKKMDNEGYMEIGGTSKTEEVITNNQNLKLTGNCTVINDVKIKDESKVTTTISGGTIKPDEIVNPASAELTVEEGVDTDDDTGQTIHYHPVIYSKLTNKGKAKLTDGTLFGILTNEDGAEKCSIGACQFYVGGDAAIKQYGKEKSMTIGVKDKFPTFTTRAKSDIFFASKDSAVTFIGVPKASPNLQKGGKLYLGGCKEASWNKHKLVYFKNDSDQLSEEEKKVVRQQSADTTKDLSLIMDIGENNLSNSGDYKLMTVTSDRLGDDYKYWIVLGKHLAPVIMPEEGTVNGNYIEVVTIMQGATKTVKLPIGEISCETGVDDITIERKNKDSGHTDSYKLEFSDTTKVTLPDITGDEELRKILTLHNGDSGMVDDEDSYGRMAYTITVNKGQKNEAKKTYDVFAGQIRITVTDKFTDSQKLSGNANTSWSFDGEQNSHLFEAAIGRWVAGDGKYLNVDLLGYFNDYKLNIVNNATTEEDNHVKIQHEGAETGVTFTHGEKQPVKRNSFRHTEKVSVTLPEYVSGTKYKNKSFTGILKTYKDEDDTAGQTDTFQFTMDTGNGKSVSSSIRKRILSQKWMVTINGTDYYTDGLYYYNEQGDKVTPPGH